MVKYLFNKKGANYMYAPKTGAWVQSATDNFNEHFETIYYLKYNIKKALYSLNKIMK